ncbi:MAG: polyprenyl synthetase family protein [Pseudomonadales bacterium]
MKTFLLTVQPELMQLNSVIEDKLRSQVPLVEEIGEHLIAAGGKRLRPLMTILAARALSADSIPPAQIYSLAAVIEFLHTATLLHDDVIDVSKLRRGRPTANATWGNASSVLVGDFLYSRAFQMLVEIDNSDVMAELANTTNLIAEGEVLQLVRAGQADTTEEQYLQIIEYKTARLFEAATRCGALLSNASATQVDALASYGHSLGMAFQLMDDYLDYAGDAAVMGKNVGDDLAEGKPTLPLIRAMQRATKAEAEQIRTAITNQSAQELTSISETVEKCGALEYTLEVAQRYTFAAQESIRALAESDTKKELLRLAELAVARNA